LGAHLSATSRSNTPLVRLALLGFAFGLALLSCGRDVTSPGANVRVARGIAWRTEFPPAYQVAGSAAAGVVDFNRVRVVLHHADGTVALDTVIDYPAGADSILISLSVQLLPSAPSSGEPLSLNLAYINAAGDTVFKGGPVGVTATPSVPGQPPPPPVTVPVSYTGPGAGAVGVQITPRSGSVVSGNSFNFTAVAVDHNGVAIPNTPIVWNTLDPSIASIPSAASGTALAGSVRGTARIVAQLLTGPIDQVTLNVLPLPTTIALQSGSGQSGLVGGTLANPLVALVTASDGLGVGGVTVTFAVTSGGGSVGSATAVTNDAGLAQSTWRLGNTAGTQTVTASAGTLAGSPVTYTATARSLAPTKLTVTAQPANATAGASLAAVTIVAQTVSGDTASAFTGAVTLTLAGGTSGATLGGTTTVNAVGGVATFSNLTVSRSGTSYSLVASSSGLTNATTNSFDIAAGVAGKLVFTAQPSSSTAGVSVGALAVTATDQFGNTVTGFTGLVTLAIASNPGAATIGGTTSANAVGGVATFGSVTLNRPGSGYTLLASATGLASATSASFDVAVGAAANIAAVGGAGQSGNVSAALPQPIVVQVQDLGGNGVAGTTVNFAVVTGGGSVLPASGVSNATGLVQTTWTLGATVGAQSISATSAGLGGSLLTINATGTSTLSHFAVTTSPTVSQVAGVTVTPGFVVSARDASNTLITAFTGTVTLAIGTNPGGGTLSGATSVSAVAGVATFNAFSIDKAGTGYTVVASAAGYTSGVSSAFNIAAGPATTMAVSAGQAQSAAASTLLPTPLAVLVTDVGGNPIAGRAIAWAVVTSGGTVDSATSHTSVAGIATVHWTLGAAAGADTVSATSAGLTGSPLMFNATGMAVGATQLKFTAQPTSATAGAAIAPVIIVTAKDALNNTVTTFTGNVTLAFSANPGGSTLSGTTTVAAVAGIATFNNITLNKAASGYTLVASSGALTPATSGTFNITSAAAATLAISAGQAQSGNTSTALATPLAMLVTDAFANPVPGVTVNWATPSGGSLAPVTSTTNAAGVATSAWTLSASVGAQTATATSAGLTGSPATFNATATVTGYSKTWTGITSTAWATATNWAPSGVPAPGDSVYIASGANQPTISAAVTVTHLTIGGGVLTLGGNAVSVLGNFMTSGTGILVMNNALDSLFVVGQATFAGGPEAGSLTNGVLVLFQGIAVSAAGQFNASGSHVTYMVGPHLVCEICGVLARGRQSVLAGARVHGAPSTIAARRAEAAAAATGARAEAAALSAARETLAAKWPSRADAARAAAAAGTTVSGIRSAAPMRTSSPRASATVGRPDVRFDVAPGARLGGRTLAASIAIQPYSASAVLVAFADTTGNQFANVRIVGSAQWQTYARAAGNVQVDTTGAIEGSGRLAIVGNLVGSYNSAVASEAVELFGVLSDTGYFSPDTTVFSGASQTMPSRVGGNSPYYNNVVVNSPALGVLAEDGNTIDIWGSLFIQNSGQLRIGAPDVNCNGCGSDEIYLYGALETHGSGTLRMNDANQPYVVVYGNALFAGGSSTGLLTQGEIDFYANFTQNSPSTTSYAATSTHESYFGASSTAPIVTFATPGYASSHFGTLYFGDTITVLMSNVFADGQLQTGGASSFRISSALDHLVTSRGANLRNVVFDNVRWETTDVGSGSGTFPSIDSVTFQNISNTTAPQFDFEYPATTNLTLAGFSFLTTPTGAGSYIKIVGPDTLTMTSVTPAFNGGFLSLSGFGAVINWPAGPTHLAFSVSPSTTVAGASITPAIVVQAQDAGNALATTFTGNVTLAIGTNPGASTLSGTVTVAAVAGVATFNDLSLNKVGTGYTLTAASTGLTGVTSSTFNVTAGPLATITVTPNPATLVISATQQFTAVGTDASGNVVAITPTWVVASGGTISSTGLFTAGTMPGTFVNIVTATSGAISGTATVIVNP